MARCPEAGLFLLALEVFNLEAGIPTLFGWDAKRGHLLVWLNQVAKISANTCAAVTSAPAPGPLMTNGRSK